MPTTRCTNGPVSAVTRCRSARSSPSTSDRLGQREQAQASRRSARRRPRSRRSRPQSWWSAIQSRLTSSMPGRTVISSAITSSRPRQASTLGGVLLDPAPVLRDVVEDVRLLGPQVRRDLRRLRGRPVPRRRRPGCARCRSTGPWYRSPRGAGHRGGGGYARLPDAALAGVQQDPGHTLIVAVYGLPALGAAGAKVRRRPPGTRGAG